MDRLPGKHWTAAMLRATQASQKLNNVDYVIIFLSLGGWGVGSCLPAPFLWGGGLKMLCPPSVRVAPPPDADSR